jgi:hypothetical protein
VPELASKEKTIEVAAVISTSRALSALESVVQSPPLDLIVTA